MKLKKLMLVGLVIVMSLGISSVALAAPPAALAANGQPPVNGCQPGADNHIVEQWQMLSLQGFAQFLVDDFGRSYEVALASAERIYAFCDHNGDNYACVMQQNLPNDANGSSKWLLIEDNHPFGGQ
jgi:hypothetical protein